MRTRSAHTHKRDPMLTHRNRALPAVIGSDTPGLPNRHIIGSATRRIRLGDGTTALQQFTLHATKGYRSTRA